MEKEENLMDFSESAECARVGAYLRPHLSTDRHMIYEDAHRSTQVLSEMHRFYQDERLCDITLRVEASQFSCHRLVLAASSLYFERMFSNDMSEAHASEVTLNDVSACSAKHLIEFAYTSKLSVAKDTVLEIFEAADMLQFPSARHFCQDFLLDQIDCQNSLSFMLYADAFSCDPLYEKAKLTAAKYFKQISADTADFLSLPIHHLLNLLKEDSIEMEYEEHIYEALKRWIMHKKTSRYQHLPELFKCIRLNYVSRWYLIEVISKDEIIMNSSECSHMVQRTKDQLLAQGHTYEIPWQLPPSRKCTGLTQKIVYINTYDPSPSKSEVFLFDLINKSWSNTSKPCPLASEFSTCESIGDALLIVGGWNVKAGTKSMNQRGAVNTIHEFRVMSIFPTLWYVGAHPMGVARYLHTTVTVGERIYLLGGYDETQSLQASMFVTDADSGYRFEVCPRMLYPVCRPAVAVWENRMFVFGGYGEGGVPRQFVQCFDLDSQKWTEIQQGIEGVYVSCQYAVTIDNLVYVLCGEMKTPHGTEHSMVGHRVAQRCINSIHTFNPLTHAWNQVYTFAESRSGSFCITSLDKMIYIAGGECSNVPYFAVDCYSPASNTIETVGNTREGTGTLSLCTTMKVMHENFGL